MRVRSALALFFVSACTHEASSPSAIGPESSHARAVPASVRPTPGEPQLSGEFQTAAPLATLEGEASYYGDSLAGHATASGEPYLPRAFTAANRHLPLGTILRVTRRDGTRSVYVRINDRGPYGSSHRILDLSRAAAAQLGMLRSGVLEVRAEVVAYGRKRRH